MKDGKSEIIRELFRHGADIADGAFHGLLGRYSGNIFERSGVWYFRLDDNQGGGDADALRAFVLRHWTAARGGGV